MAEFTERNVRLGQLGLLKTSLGIVRMVLRPEDGILHIYVIWILIVRYVVYLLGLGSHEAVCGGNVAEVAPWQVVLGQHILIGYLKVRLKVVDEAFFIHALHVFVWVELVFEFAVVFRICLVHHVPEVLPGERLPRNCTHLKVHDFLLGHASICIYCLEWSSLKHGILRDVLAVVHKSDALAQTMAAEPSIVVANTK